MQHVIRKQILDFNIGRNLDKFHTQHLISNYYKNVILSSLENTFDKISSEDEVIYLDNVKIDIGELDINILENYRSSKEIENIIYDELSKLVKSKDKHVVSRKSVSLNAFEQWVFFLKKGFLPWNTLQSFDSIVAEVPVLLSQSKHYISILQELILDNITVIKRLVYQHTDKFLIKIFKLTFPEVIGRLTGKEILLVLVEIKKALAKEKDGKRILQESESPFIEFTKKLLVDKKLQEKKIKKPVDKEIKKSIKTKSDKIHVKDREIEETFKVRDKDIEETLSEDVLQEYLESSDSKEIPSIDEEGIFVQQAGLVLLHPFLKQFFTKLKLVSDKNFIHEKAREKALFILHYIATGEQSPEEHLLVIPKILCDFPLEDPVPRKHKLTKIGINESNELLKAIIAKWTVLKNTSPATLQQEFLQRNGKLFIKNDKLSLLVEARTIDVLLDHLPWNLSIIKLPWKKDIIWVEWR